MPPKNNHSESIIRAAHARVCSRDMTHFAGGMTAHDVGLLLADQIGNRGKKDYDYLKNRWVRSSEFVPMELPVEILYPVRVPSGRTKSFSTGPLVVEVNFRGVEQTDAGKPNGFTPPYVIIDGQHRWYTARQSGQELIHTVVGLRAIPLVVAELLKWASTKRNTE